MNKMKDVICVELRSEPSLDSPLDALADQLGSLDFDLHTDRATTATPTKGVEIVIAIGIPLIALQQLVSSITPILVAWLNRPRTQRVSVIFRDGETERSLVLEADGQGSREFLEVLSSVAHISKP